MKSIKLRVLLLLLYLVVLGVYLYPKGASLSDPEGVQWLAVMGGTLLVIVLLREEAPETSHDDRRDDPEAEG